MTDSGCDLETILEKDMNPFDQLLEKIARKHLFIDTLETRNNNRMVISNLDFHKIGIENLKSALKAAFMAGTEVGIDVAKK